MPKSLGKNVGMGGESRKGGQAGQGPHPLEATREKPQPFPLMGSLRPSGFEGPAMYFQHQIHWDILGKKSKGRQHSPPNTPSPGRST